MPTTTPSGTDHTSEHQEHVQSFEWRQCPRHVWFGVSVLVTSDHAVCVPPNGEPNHRIELSQTKPVPWRSRVAA